MKNILKIITIYILWNINFTKSSWYNGNFGNWINVLDNLNVNYHEFIISDEYDFCCDEIIKNFEKGKRAFDNQLNAEMTLVKDGILTKIDDPFSLLFFGIDFQHIRRTKDFTTSLRSLRGIQYVLDAEMKNYLGKPRPNQTEIQKFLTKISVCIPKEERCSIDSEIICDPYEKYRSLDGTCNNLARPLQGASFTPYARITEPFYDDYVMEPRKNWKGTDLTSPRRLSDKILTRPIITKLPSDLIPNMAFNMFGQLLTHDVAGILNTNHNTRTGIVNSTRCCSNDYKKILPKSESHFGCLPFNIAPDDKYHQNTNFRCHSFLRSQPGFRPDCSLAPASQINVANSYIDLSVIYGQNELRDVRTHMNGLLKNGANNILPVKEECNGKACYFTGDFRVNQTPSLAAMHSLFVRFHNLLATTLARINPMWNDEKIFQEARRINIAIFQHIVFEEYAPMLVSERLTCDPVSSLCDYNPNVDGSTTNDFTTSVFRHLHIFCPKSFEYYDENGQITSNVLLSDIIEDTRLLEPEYDNIIRGLINQKIFLMGYSEDLRNKVFGGSDLIAVDIQRGRDHGLAPYWKYREICGFGSVNSFNDLSPLISKQNIEALKTVYSSPKDIDILIGGALEEKGTSLLGPTFQCIAKTQFLRYRQGDRFFYTHLRGTYPFTSRQLEEIKNFSFSKLLCAVTGVTKVPLKGLYRPSKTNYLVPCDTLRMLDLAAWKE